MTEQLDVVRTALRDIGLNEVEVAVYGAALALGPRPVSKIAKQAGINRAHTYDVLSSLAQKGLMQEIIKNSVKHFCCNPPDSLLQIVDERESRLAAQRQKLLDALPSIEKLRNPDSSQPSVRYFQGVDGIKKVLEDTLNTPQQTIHGFADAIYSSSLAGDRHEEWREEFAKERVRKGIWYIGILNAPQSLKHEADDEQDSFDPAPTMPSSTEPAEPGSRNVESCDYRRKLKTKTLADVSVPVEIIAYGSRVAILSSFQEKIGLILDNISIAEAVRGLHQTIWNKIL